MSTMEEIPQTSPVTFEELYTNQFPRLAWMAEGQGALCNGQDVAQETMIRLLTKGQDVRYERAGSWLRTVAKNLVIDRARKPSTRNEVTVDDTAWKGHEQPSGEPDPYRSTLVRSLAERALSYMNPDQREVILLTTFGGRTVVEAAAELSLPVGTVRSRRYYGMLAARKGLAELGVDASVLGDV